MSSAQCPQSMAGTDPWVPPATPSPLCCTQQAQWSLHLSWDDGERAGLWVCESHLLLCSDPARAPQHWLTPAVHPALLKVCQCAGESWALDLSHLLQKLRPAGTCYRQSFSSELSELISMPIKSKSEFCLWTTAPRPTWTWGFCGIVSLGKIKSLKNTFYFKFFPDN